MVLRLTDKQFQALSGKRPPAPANRTPKGSPTDAYRSNKKGWREFSGEKRYYLKSLWEINYAHYLEFLKKNGTIQEWEYEPEFFEFPKENYRTGPFYYKPDFRITNKNGTTEWHEVKGWMNNSSKKKIKRFHTHYPKEELHIIGKKWFQQNGKKLRQLIPAWESL